LPRDGRATATDRSGRAIPAPISQVTPRTQDQQKAARTKDTMLHTAPVHQPDKVSLISSRLGLPSGSGLS
jgi:hypothetical protein